MIFIYDDYGELMFSRKFMIYEDIAMWAVVKRTRDMSTIQEKQTVNFVINSGRINFNNPLQTVKTLIIQNNNLNTAITDFKPQYILGNKLTLDMIRKQRFRAAMSICFLKTKMLEWQMLVFNL